MGKFRCVPPFLPSFLPSFLSFSPCFLPCTHFLVQTCICTNIYAHACILFACAPSTSFLPSFIECAPTNYKVGFVFTGITRLTQLLLFRSTPSFAADSGGCQCEKIVIIANFKKDWPSCATSGGRICLLNNASPISNSLRAYFEQHQNDGRWTYSSNREKQGGSLRGGHQKFDNTSRIIE